MSRKSRSVQAKTPGVLKIPLKLVDFPTFFMVFLVNSRHQAQKRKFLFSDRVKFCRKLCLLYFGILDFYIFGLFLGPRALGPRPGPKHADLLE